MAAAGMFQYGARTGRRPGETMALPLKGPHLRIPTVKWDAKNKMYSHWPERQLGKELQHTHTAVNPARILPHPADSPNIAQSTLFDATFTVTHPLSAM